ncbi:glutamate--tRNA ligase [Selenomonadales bacterium OttesenSCG-928-I06]|nr:glutamate--tRNA ligase [Selenomonadales bacterium OttesenSCG-928-I06]
MINGEIRLRFAPSPTGPFHIGGARSALFNWLLAKKHNGTLIVRFEDTDRERSTVESEENIKDSLLWLGLNWDEGIDVGGENGPYRQIERLGIYQEYTDKLVESGHAYYCYCSEEELEEDRKQSFEEGSNPIYSGRCRDLSPEDKAKFVQEGRKPTVRFHVPPEGQVMFKDLIRGAISFEKSGIGDFVIVKSDGIPVYNYAVVLDDALMKVTHVIRAEEHLSNTPRQIVLYEALGFKQPEFGHVSLILGKDKTKMSKRQGATSVTEYRKLGYLPEAIVNFLALLGWSTEREDEIFSVEELIQEFSLERVSKSPAVFDVDKLNFINSQYIKKSSPERIADIIKPHLVKAGFIKDENSADENEYLVKVAAEIKDYLSFGAQAPEHAGIFYVDEIQFENEEAAETLKSEEAKNLIETFKVRLSELEEVNPENMKALIKNLGKELSVKGKQLFMPLRVAITGKMHGPELINIVPLIGRERTIKRADFALKMAGH